MRALHPRRREIPAISARFKFTGSSRVFRKWGLRAPSPRALIHASSLAFTEVRGKRAWLRDALLHRARQAVRTATSSRTCCVRLRRTDRARHSARPIQRACGRRVSCDLCSARSGGCRWPGRSRRPTSRSRSTPERSGNVPAVFWPLIGGFIAVVIITLLIGRIMDTSGRDTGGDH